MIKKALLERLAMNQSRLADYSVDFDQAYSIGIIGQYHSAHQPLLDIKSWLEADGKRVDLVELAHKPDNETVYPKTTFFTSDVSLLGKIQKEALRKFCDKPFDFLIVVDHAANALLKFIISKSNARQKVGLYQKDFEGILTMMVRPKDPKEGIKELYHYLKMIKHV